MRKLLGLAVLSVLPVATTAQAATVVAPFDGDLPNELGLAYPTLHPVTLAASGQPSIYAVIRWTSGELVGAWATGYYATTFGYYDPIWPDNTDYNEADYPVDCTLASGCVKLVGPRTAYAKLDLPEVYDRTPCSAADPNCYQRVNYSSIGFEFAFHSLDGEVVSGTVTFQDHAPVPEPATWAMMIGGFGLAGAALRRKRGGVAAA